MITETEGGIEVPAIIMDIGNQSIGMATWFKGRVRTPVNIDSTKPGEIDSAISAHFEACPKGRPGAVVIASVVPEVLAKVTEMLDRRMEKAALVVGKNLPFPMDVSVDDPQEIGVDRVCAAAAAYDELGSACTIIDFGTAVTVDLVDDEGSLLGGAILPGLRTQIKSLHEGTAQLPEVELGFPELAYGKNTVEAIQAGVCKGLAGACRALVEAYAESLNRWPQVIATGGDVQFMLPHCDFIDTAVDGLVLKGVGLAYTKHVTVMGG